MSDPFDGLLFLEDSFYQDGVEIGKKNSQPIGHLQGRLHGGEKGFDFGNKVGFYEGVVKTVLKIHEQTPDKVPNRAVKPLKNLLDYIEKIPTHNDYEIDYVQILDKLHAKFKLVCVILGLPTVTAPFAKKEQDLGF